MDQFQRQTHDSQHNVRRWRITAATDFMDKLEQFVNAECIIQAGKVLQLQWQLSKQGVNNTHISEMALNRRI